MELTGVAGHCAVTGPNPASVAVPVGGQGQHTFAIACDGAIIDVTANVIGALPSSADLRVRVGDEVRSIEPDGTQSFVVGVGSFDVELLGVPAECTIQGQSLVTVSTSGGGDQTSIEFDVDCPPGDLVVNVTTLGNDDVTFYRVVLDQTDQRTIPAIDGSLTFAQVPNGLHSVELLDTPDECAVLGQNPRDVEAPGRTDFVVDCGGGPGEVVYESWQGGIWRMRGDGSVPTRITDVNASDTRGSPRLSPDVTAVVFRRGGVFGESGLWVVGFDGANLRQLAADYTISGPNGDGSVVWEEPSWSPDASRIVAVRHAYVSDLYGEFEGLVTIDPTTGDWTPLLDADATGIGASHPDWSVRDEIVFETSTGTGSTGRGVLMVMPALGGTPFTAYAAAAGVGVQVPRWSPDGNRIAFVEVHPQQSGGTQNWPVIVNSDGTGRVDVLLPGGGDLRISSVAWSPDGERLMISGAIYGQTGIFTVKTDGTELTRIGGGAWPDWRETPPGS